MTDKTELLALAERDFAAAIEATPEHIRERLDKGQQFNCYEFAENSEWDHPDDLEYYLALGPITDFSSIALIDGEWRAKLIEAAFRVALRSHRAKAGAA